MNKNFSLEAYSCTLLDLNSEKALFGIERKYIIPIYQRPYAWEEKHIQDLFTTIFDSYKAKDACFLGTMQLIPKGGDEYEVVDGQQRISTLLLIFKVLQLKIPALKIPTHILNTTWLNSEVNAGKQQEWMQYVLNIVSIEDFNKEQKGTERNVNRYLANAIYIAEILEAQMIEDDNKFIIDSHFLNYFLTQVYFVIVETTAGLTKTLEIFKTINTSGMDLNGGNIFKIRMYEYLTKIKKQSSAIFNKIDALYASADEYNKILKRQEVSIVDALNTYKYILIEKTTANRSLHDLGPDLFYERVFNSILSNKIEKDVDRNKFEQALCLEDIDKLLKMRYLWETKYGRASNVHNWQHCLLWSYTRYSRYCMMDIIYMYCYHKEDNFDVNKFHKFSELLLRYFIIYSIRFAKAVNSVHTFCYNVLAEMFKSDSTPDAILAFLEREIAERAEYRTLYENILRGDISDNTKKRKLICWLSAILKEDYQNESCNIVNKLFSGNLDVEHIEPCNPSIKGDERMNRQKKWETNLNTIGNLVLLGSTINRAGNFNNKNFDVKYPQYVKYAKDFDIKVIENLVNQNQDKIWTIEKCEKRCKEEVQTISNFLFGKSSGVIGYGQYSQYRKK